VDPHPLAGGEGDLVLAGEVPGVEHRHVEPAAQRPEGDGAAAPGELGRQQLLHLVGDAAQLLDPHRRHPELLGEALLQELLGQGIHLQETGAQSAAHDVLVLERTGQLLDGDPAPRHEQLSKLTHLRPVGSVFQAFDSVSNFLSVGNLTVERRL